MEKSYQNRIGFYFIAVYIMVIAGFLFTYIVKFPNFEGFTIVHHLHGFVFSIWLFMLIVQPFLIRYKKYRLHRLIGKASYLLAPILILSIFFVLKLAYHRDMATFSKTELLANVAIGFPDMIVFSAYYVLAIIHKNSVALHMRYMIGTSFMVLGPGLGRALIIYGSMTTNTAIPLSNYIIATLILVFLAFDMVNKRPIRPFVTIFCWFLLMIILFNYRYSSLWQSFAQWWANNLF